MKSFFALIIILLISSFVFADNGIDVKRSLFPDTPSAYMHEDNNGGGGTFQILTTTFTQWSGVTSSSGTPGLIVDEGAGTITISQGLEGRYVGTLHSSFKAPTGKTITIAIFKNNTAIDDIKRSMARGPERMPTFRSISSDDSSATFDTNSSLSYLEALDGDDIIIQEAGTGSTGCSYLKIRYSNVDSPSRVHVSAVYQSNNANHWQNAKMLNYSSDTHTELNEATKDWEDVGASIEPYERTSWSFKVPSPQSEYVENGISEVILYHNDVNCADTHRFHLDETHIVDDFSSAVIAFPVEFNVEAEDVLSIRYKANEDSVALNISDLGLNIFKIGN